MYIIKIIFFSGAIFYLQAIARPSTEENNPQGPNDYRAPDAKSGEYQRPLSDEERVKAIEFQHGGLLQRTLKEECGKSKERQAACDGKEATVFGNKDELVKVVSRMYSLFMGQLGNGQITSAKGGDGAEAIKDPCGYIPIGITLVAQTTQVAQQNNIGAQASNSGVAQKEYLYKQARTHRARAKTAIIETAGWGATAGCYVTFAASKFGFQVNKSTYLKMGSAAFLSFFYNHQRIRHNKYADMVNDIANALPGKGDCNPVTERSCYCAQKETVNDPQYCLPTTGNSNRKLPPGTTSIHCANAQMMSDPDCHCSTSGSCANQNFQQLFSIPEFSTQNTAGKLLRNAGHLANGQFNPMLLGSTPFGQGAFKRAFRSMDQKVPAIDKPLTEDQKKMAKTLMKSGIGKRLAVQMAQNASLSSHGKKLMDRLGQQSSLPNIEAIADRIPHLSYNDPFRKKNPPRRGHQGAGFPHSLKKKKREPQYHDEIIQFAQEAQNKASVSQNRGQNIFELVSHRYQNGGWEKLEFKMP